METAKAQLPSSRFGFLLLDGNRQGATSQLTLRVSIARWKPPRRNFPAHASGFYCSMETAKAQLPSSRFGFLLLDGNRQGATSQLTLRVSIARWKPPRRNFPAYASGFYCSMETAKAQLQTALIGWSP